MDHAIIAHIDPHMGDARGIIGALEENKVAGPGIASGNRRAVAIQPLGTGSAHAPPAFV